MRFISNFPKVRILKFNDCVENDLVVSIEEWCQAIDRFSFSSIYGTITPLSTEAFEMFENVKVLLILMCW